MAESNSVAADDGDALNAETLIKIANVNSAMVRPITRGGLTRIQFMEQLVLGT